MVQTPGAKYGDCGHVRRALRIGVTEGSGHVYPGKLNRPPLPSSDNGALDVRYPGGTSADRIPDMRYPGGMRENFRSGEMSDAMCRKGPDP